MSYIHIETIKKMIKLSEHYDCTGCGACAYACKKKCIIMKENPIGILLPHIDLSDCIGCRQCEKVCPQINKNEFNTPKKAYASWSNNEKERMSSASGGVAMEMYKLAHNKNYKIIGAIQKADFSVELQLTDSIEYAKDFKNSKYVFSSISNLYSAIKESQKKNENILVIALPCQIAAIKKIFPYQENLLLVDIVCHGVTPYKYLSEHINYLERKYNNKTSKMYFRDPNLYTYTFTFTLYNSDNQCFYAKRTKHGDLYQFGYHRSISYRENCYHCHYAQRYRLADITLSDYNGLGKEAPCSYTQHNVSMILTNTAKGQSFFNELVSKKYIFAEERPLEEPIKYNPQLLRFMKKNKYRLEFEHKIKETNGFFIPAIIPIYKKYKLEALIQNLFKVPQKVFDKLIKGIISYDKN